MLQLLAVDIGTTWHMQFELDMILWLQSLGGKGTFLYYLMNFITMFGEEVILVAIMGLLYWGLDKRNGEKIALMLVSASLYTPLIKNIACRTRPFNTATDVQNFRNVSGYSFPSGHSSGSASVFVGLEVVYHKKRWKWLLGCAIAIPLLVALSRMYLGAHYLTDVIAGLALGTGIVFLYQFLFTRLNKWYIYIGTLLVGFLGFFYCTTEDFYTGYGLVLGLACGVLFEQKITKFQNTKIWWRILLRVIFGGVVYLGLNELIKLPFNNLLFDAQGNVKDNMIVAERIFRTLRYAIVNFIGIAIYPMLFKVFDKVWVKLKFLKPEQLADNNTENCTSNITADNTATDSSNEIISEQPQEIEKTDCSLESNSECNTDSVENSDTSVDEQQNKE